MIYCLNIKASLLGSAENGNSRIGGHGTTMKSGEMDEPLFTLQLM